MGAITFNDGTAARLRNNFPPPAHRFSNWVPMTRPFGDSVPRLSDGALTMFRTRTDYGASFDFVGIPVKYSGAIGDVTAGGNLVSAADRLIAWLLAGGTCGVECEDPLFSAYPTCGLWPGSTPSLRLTNTRTLEYTLSLQLINLAGSPVPMLCTYA